MKLIRTEKLNIIGTNDIIRIVHEMINIYHGRKYFLDTGLIDLNAKPDYLEWDVGNITYSYEPVRGYIYINYTNGLKDKAYARNLCQLLYITFVRLNQWGMRKTLNIDHASGTNQFTMEKCDADLYTRGANLLITEGSPFHSKHSENKFCWIISNCASLFQYSTPGKFINQHMMIASAVTIAVDITHKEDIDDGYRIIGFPPLKRDIQLILPVILLSRILGIDGHIYHRLGGPSPNSKCWDQFSELTCIIQKDEIVTETKVHRVKEISDLKNQTNPDDSGNDCTVCNTAIFGKYYQISENDQPAIICRFCAHFNNKIAVELNTGKYKIAISSISTTENAIELVPMEASERDAIRVLHQEINKGGLCIMQPEINSEFGSIATYCFIISGAKKLVGLQSGIVQQVIEQIHKFPEHTMIFEYQSCWN